MVILNQSEDNLESEVLNENEETLQEEEKENSDEDGKTSDNNEKNVSDSLILNILKIKPKSRIKNIVGRPHLIIKYSEKYLHQETDLFFDWYLPLFFKKKKDY